MTSSWTVAPLVLLAAMTGNTPVDNAIAQAQRRPAPEAQLVLLRVEPVAERENAAVLVVFNLLADLALAALDPRTR